MTVAAAPPPRGAIAALLLALAGAAGADRPPSAGLSGLYVALHPVRSGETVDTLLRDFRTTRGTLESLNPGVDLNRLKPGDRVRILSRPGVFERLERGLTASDVAAAYQVELDDLLGANGIENPRRVPSGLELFIPSASPLPDDRRRRLARRQQARARAVRVPPSMFIKPLGTAGRLVVSDAFGSRRNPFTGLPQLHAGIDLVAEMGAPILAAREGLVIWSGWKGGYGKLVILRHANGYETYYGHALELLVTEGQQVAQGQVIARVGASGDATAPHLHFEVRYDGSVRNPQRYLSRWF